MLLNLPMAQVDWSSEEELELRRLHVVYPTPHYKIECSLTEDGDPWCVVLDRFRDAIALHVARIGHRYVVVKPDKNMSWTVVTIKAAIDLAI